MKRQSLALAITVLSAAAAADEYLDPKRTVDPPKCRKPGKDSPFCNHPECGAKLDTPGRLSSKAWTQGHAHWMPWSIVYPQGREVEDICPVREDEPDVLYVCWLFHDAS